MRTLHREAKCPECATEVVKSLRINWLLLSDPKWVKKVAGGLRQGVRMIGFTLAWIAVMIMLFPFAMLVSPWPSAPFIVAVLLSIVVLAYVAINTVEGIWRFTQREPAGGDGAVSWRVRGFIRLMTILTTVGAATTIGLLWCPRELEVRIGVGLIGGFCFLCSHVAVLICFRRLALRMSGYKEARIALYLAIGFVAGITLVLTGWWPVVKLVLLGPEIRVPGAGGTAFYGYVLVAGGLLMAALLISFVILANRVYVMLEATANGIAATEDPGMAAAIAGRTMLIWGWSR